MPQNVNHRGLFVTMLVAVAVIGHVGPSRAVPTDSGETLYNGITLPGELKVSGTFNRPHKTKEKSRKIVPDTFN